MTIYNMTTRVIRLSAGDKVVMLPASSQDGVKGPAVELDPKDKFNLCKEWKLLLNLKNDGSIEVE